MVDFVESFVEIEEVEGAMGPVKDEVFAEEGEVDLPDELESY